MKTIQINTENYFYWCNLCWNSISFGGILVQNNGKIKQIIWIVFLKQFLGKLEKCCTELVEEDYFWKVFEKSNNK